MFPVAHKSSPKIHSLGSFSPSDCNSSFVARSTSPFRTISSNTASGATSRSRSLPPTLPRNSTATASTAERPKNLPTRFSRANLPAPRGRVHSMRRPRKNRWSQIRNSHPLPRTPHELLLRRHRPRSKFPRALVEPQPFHLRNQPPAKSVHLFVESVDPSAFRQPFLNFPDVLHAEGAYFPSTSASILIWHGRQPQVRAA